MSGRTDTAPRWWEALQEGQRVPLACLKIDRVGSREESKLLPTEDAERLHRDYTAGIEWIGRSYGAAQPLHWQGDGVMLFFTDDASRTPPLAPAQAFLAAKALWRRVNIEIRVRTRIAVHAGFVPWNPDTGKLFHDTLNLCGHLEADTPPNGVGVTEDIFLLLSDEQQKECTSLGITKRDHIPAYVYPAAVAAKRDLARFMEGHDDELWAKFRNYAVSSEIRLLRYVGFGLTRKEPPALDIREVFVPATVQTSERSRLTQIRERRARVGKEKTGRQAVGQEREERPFAPGEFEGEFTREATLAEVLRQNRALVVLGDPGSGKTTLLRWLAVSAARGAYGMGLDLGLAERLLPVPVSVGRLAEIRSELGSTAPVAECLARYFHARNLGTQEHLKGFLEARLKAGECLVLLDGLDEVQSAERDNVQVWLETFASQYPGNRWVVSSRFVGYRGFALSGGKEVALRPFNDEQVQKYTSAFCRAYVRWESNGSADAAAGDRAAAQLSEALEKNPRLKGLARNPFLLSGMALIHRAEGRLPAHRVQFYQVFSRCLCEAWSTARRLVAESAGVASAALSYEGEALPILGALALKMHNDHPSGRAPREYVIKVLASVLQKKRSVPPDEARQAAEVFLRRVGERVQIFLERGPDEWGFLHLTFQEFFAAAGLHAEGRFAREALKHLFDPRWEEVIRLGVGYMALVQGRPKDARDFVWKKVRKYRDKRRPWVTDVLRRQVPMAALLAAEAEGALSPEEQREVAAELAEWVLGDFPWTDRTWGVLSEIALTEFAALAAEPFIAALKHKDAYVRDCAACALGQLRSNGALQSLCAAVQDMDASVRRRALDALGELKSEAALQHILRAIEDKNASVRWGAVFALAQLKSEAAIRPLLAALQNKDASIRGSAADALGELKSGSALQNLVAALKDEDATVRGRAAGALGKLKSEAALKPLLASLQDRSSSARRKTAQALGELAEEIVLQPLLRALQDENAYVREGAAQSLGERKSEAAIQPLVAALNDKNALVRGSAAYALGQMKSDTVVQKLLSALKDRKPSVRSSATLALGQLKSEVAFQPLLTSLQDKNATVRGNAAQALAQLKIDAALHPLLAALHDKDPFVRESAAQSLGELGSEAALQALLAAIRDESTSVRQCAVYALRKLKSEAALQHLISTLHDKDPYVRGSAASVLGEWRSQAAVQPLLAALDDEGGYVRQDAADALVAISESPATSKMRQAPARTRGRPRKTTAAHHRKQRRKQSQ